MIEYFKPSDFIFGLDSRNEEAAYMANRKLQELIDAAPVVYDGTDGVSFLHEEIWGYYKYDEKSYIAISSNFKNSTRKARLMFIEELKKECMKHEPVTYASQGLGEVNLSLVKCKHCNVELMADWRAK